MNQPSIVMQNRSILRRFTSGLLLAVVYLVTTTSASAAEKTRLIVDFNDGVQMHFTKLDLAEKATAIDLLKSVESHARGVKSIVRGSGQTAIVTTIDGIKNEGGGRESKNWIYYINDKRAEIGGGVYEVRAGDVIMWKFDTLRMQ